MPARRVNRENLMHVGNLFREQPHQLAGGDLGSATNDGSEPIPSPATSISRSIRLLLAINRE